MKFSTNFQLLQIDPKLEEVTRRDVGNAMRDSHFFSHSGVWCGYTHSSGDTALWPIWDLVKFSNIFQLLQTSPKLEEVTHRDVGNAMRDSHFFHTRVSGVDTHTRADDGRRRSSDGSILDSGDILRYTKRSVENQ